MIISNSIVGARLSRQRGGFFHPIRYVRDSSYAICSSIIDGSRTSPVSVLQTVMSRTGINGLRTPLHLALAVSPLVLFIPTLLHKQELGRTNMVNVRLFSKMALDLLSLCFNFFCNFWFILVLAVLGKPETTSPPESRSDTMEDDETIGNRQRHDEGHPTGIARGARFSGWE